MVKGRGWRASGVKHIAAAPLPPVVGLRGSRGTFLIIKKLDSLSRVRGLRSLGEG